MPNESANKRKHIRFMDPESKPIRFRYRFAGQQEGDFYALIADESYSGLGCIYIGNVAAEEGDSILWIESEEIETLCRIVRCYCLEKNVYFLGITIPSV